MANPNPKTNDTDSDAALNLVRQKVSRLYQNEPSAEAELADIEQSSKLSKHQQFMHQLSTSGQSLADIQSAWHNYYAGLPDDQKYEVWREFYDQHSRFKPIVDKLRSPQPLADQPTEPKPTDHRSIKPLASSDVRSLLDIKEELLSRLATTPRQLSKRRHIKSLMFGLGLASLVIVLLLFSFFNERFIAPFITPSRSISNTALLIDPATAAVGPDPKIIIPKINVELPINFTETSDDEKTIQNDLQNGVIHYASTSFPGQDGNGAIFGHSSNNIFNKGNYKFAFVLLKKLDINDTFYIQYQSKRYVYKVYDKKIVKPTELSVLNNADRPATFTLITCDPPGTSLNRLVVWGEQISPDVSTNTKSTANKNLPQPKVLPSNAPSLWQHITSWF